MHLKLQTLSKRGAYCLFIANWAAVLFAFTFGLYEQQLRLSVSVVESLQLSELRYELVLDDVPRLAQFIFVSAAIDGFAPGANVSTEIYGVPYGGGNYSLIEQRIAVLQNDTSRCRLALSDGKAVDWSPSNASQCAVVDLFYEQRLRNSGYRFDILLDAATAPPHLRARDVRFIVASHNQLFSLIELTTVTVVALFTVLFLLYWLSMYVSARRKLLPEQRWQTVLLCGLLISQRPLMLVSVLSPFNSAFELVATVSESLAVTIIMWFLLALLDALSHSERDLPGYYEINLFKNIVRVINICI